MSIKRSALFALGLLFVASAGFAEDPAAKPQATADTIQSGRADRAALRADLRSAGAAAHAELRVERADGDRTRPARPDRPAAAVDRTLSEQKSAQRDDQRQAVRELRRESREERRDALRGFIRRTQ